MNKGSAKNHTEFSESSADDLFSQNLEQTHKIFELEKQLKFWEDKCLDLKLNLNMQTVQVQEQSSSSKQTQEQ